METQFTITRARTSRMTQCNSERIHFSRVERQQVVADFNGWRLTSDAGVLLLREIDRQIGLIDAINDCLPDPRDQRFTIHEQREMIAQRFYSIALEDEELNDQHTLRDDPALQLAAGKSPEPDDPLASPPNSVSTGKPSQPRRSGEDVGVVCRAVPGSTRCSAERDRAGLRRHERPGSRPAGVAFLSGLLSALLLPAAVRVLRRAPVVCSAEAGKY